MQKISKDNVIVLCTLLLCIAFTFTLCIVYSGDGLLAVFSSTQIPQKSLWMIVSSGYSDITLARTSAEMVKNRGAAGYVKSGDDIKIIYAVYDDEDSAKDALTRLASSGLYIEEVKIKECDFKWCDKEYKQAVESALSYFQIAFDTLNDCANSLSNGSAQIVDVKTKIAVLSSQIEEIKSVFYQNVANCDCNEISQIKLALVTTLALLDNIDFDNSTALLISSLRYQCVQLSFCYQALMQSI